MFNRLFFFFKELSVSVIVTSEVRKPEPDTRGIISQGPLFIIFLLFPLTTLCPGGIGHTNNCLHNGLFQDSSGHFYLQSKKWLIAAQVIC